jgi:hypothetical protein
MPRLLGATVLAALAGGLWLLSFVVGVPRINEQPAPPSTPHLATDVGQSLRAVEVRAVYFVPRDRLNRLLPDWLSTIERTLDEVRAFHERQLKNTSRLTYRLYPEPVIGRDDAAAYDTAVTDGGNPEALRRISRELEERLFTPGGDRYRPAFVAASEDAYRPLLIIYEGVGASGAVGEPAALVSRLFLTQDEYRAVSPTLVAHELYHTFGLPDAYDAGHGEPTGSDLMGQGRFRPIGRAFLDRASLTALGL